MKTAAIVVGVAILSFAGGAWWNRGQPPPAGRRILYYHDPMHPAYRSDKPGVAPDCGMELVPVYAGEQSADAPAPGVSPLPPGSVRIGDDQQRMIGVRVVEVGRTDAGHEVRVLGRVSADESRLHVVNSPGEGLVRELSGVATGSLVEKDQPLVSFFSRESLSFRDQQAYLSLLGNTPPGGDNIYAAFARDSLLLFGLSETQLRELEKTRKLDSTIRILSPVKGVVLSRSLFPGQRFTAGTELYRIADLSSVWVLADVFESEARLLDSVAGVHVRYQGRDFPARMSAAAPRFDADARTLKVRLDAANPGQVLRPGMFVDVGLEVKLHSVLTAPAEAVLDSGLRKIVFVDRGNGWFEPRKVETGARLGDRIVIAKGLDPGERVAASGNFLIDSESRLQLAAAAAAPAAQKAAQKAAQRAPAKAAAKDPVCGMDVDPSKAGHKSEYKGSTYYFCSPGCKAKFDANPSKYTGKKDPAAGMME
jgi:Cu(I)/Ag(I) efflux system membrane fusion protein